jgi:DNA-nicking Smr family endonuclease
MDGDELFQRAMRRVGVGPDQGGEGPDGAGDEFAAAMAALDPEVPPEAPEEPKPPPAPQHDVAPDAADFVAAMETLVVAGTEDTPTAGEAPPDLGVGVRRTLQRRIRQGSIVADRELDLHGLRREEAERAVASFLRRSQSDGLGVVRIICGRGLHSRERAVLQEALEGWLRRSHADRVKDAVPAPSAQGGRGVWYAFLRTRAP